MTKYKTGQADPEKYVVEFESPVTSVALMCRGQQVLIVWDVEYSAEVIEHLAAPTITFDNTSLEVSITAPEGAKKICYTIDGSLPTENSEEYKESFTVADGTRVRAIAVGDDENWLTSTVASTVVLLGSGTVANPVISDYMGAFSIKCETPAVTIKYRYKGEDDNAWKTYGLPVTVFENKKVEAQAFRDGWKESVVVDADINVPAYAEDHKHVIIGAGSFTYANDKEKDKTLMGVAGNLNSAFGFNLSMSEGAFKAGDKNNKIKIYGKPVDDANNITRTEIIGIKDAEITLQIPDGVSVTRMFFYTLIHDVAGEEITEDCAWEVLYGTNWVSSIDVPEESRDKNDPAVRVFTFPKAVPDAITFRHVGSTPYFCLVLDVTYDDVEAPKRDNTEAETLSVEKDDLTISLEPQYSHHEIWAKYELHPYYASGRDQTPSRAANAKSDLTSEYQKLTETNADGNYEVVIPKNYAGTLTYYSKDPYTGVQSDPVEVKVADDASTGIEDVLVDGAEGVAEYYNLQGQRVLNPVKGNLYIVKRAGKATKIVL